MGQEQAALYNTFMAPKVGPGSANQKRPLWLFKGDGQGLTDMSREMSHVNNASVNALGATARPLFAKASHDSIATWLEQFRIRMKTASVRFLASQDSSVLGAQLYTQQAFDKLMRRAGAITDDMLREAATLRSGENADDELAHQLSLLLEETVETTRKMNALAQVVHEIMLRRINKLQTEHTLGSVTQEQGRMYGIGGGLGGGLANSLGNCGSGSLGDVKDDDRQNMFYDKPALLSLASLSGVFGEVSLGGSSAETEHMHKLLKDIETVMAEKRVAIDHRAHGFKTCKNAGSQMTRTQRAVKHNTLFGMMTSHLESAAASLSDKPA